MHASVCFYNGVYCIWLAVSTTDRRLPGITEFSVDCRVMGEVFIVAADSVPVLVDRVALSVALRIELRVVNSWQPLN